MSLTDTLHSMKPSDTTWPASVAVMLDEPQRGVLDGGAGGQSAAPVFKQIAGWLLNRENRLRDAEPVDDTYDDVYVAVAGPDGTIVEKKVSKVR